MRISDWSADVCSSDLLLSVFLLGEKFEQNEKPIFERCNPGQWGDRSQLTATKKFVDRDFNEKFAKPLDAVVRHIPLDEHSKLSPIFQKLGRASCRERVCQYVKISGVAV